MLKHTQTISCHKLKHSFIDLDLVSSYNGLGMHHLSRLGDGHRDVVVMGGDLPEVLLMPTVEFHGRGGKIEVDDSCNRTLFC